MLKKSVKIGYKESFVPYNLLEHIIKETDIEKLTIEEGQSELYFDTLSGQGKVFFKNNSVYEGNMKFGILESGEEGKTSILTFPNGTKYEGEIHNNQIMGKGAYTFNSGSIYKGEVKQGLRHGYGVYTSLDGIKYEGNWKNGLKHGIGKMNMNSSMVYEGEWQEGIIQGTGKIRWTSGNYYEGEFKNNKINGNGYLIWYDSSEKFFGQWTDSLQNGLGVHIWYELKGEQKYLRNRYVGEWRNGFRHGYGVFFYSNGSKYEGTWDQNYKHGFGVFTFYDGSQYIGRFHNDRMLDFNPSGLYAPANLNKVAEGGKSTITGSTSSQPRGNKKPLQNGVVAGVIKEENENENITASSNFHGNITNRDRMNLSSSNLNHIISNNESGNVNNAKLKIVAGKGLEEIPENNQSFNAGTNNLNKNVTSTKGNNESNLILSNTNLINPINGLNPSSQNNLNIHFQSQNSNQNNPINESFMGKIKKDEKDPIVATRTIHAKEAELNQFKTALDITDIIECEPDIESSLREIENILLRHLTEMKDWYSKYLGKGIKDSNKDELNMTNASMMGNNDNNRTSAYVMLKEEKFVEESGRQPSMTNLNEKNGITVSEGVYNNDLGFCMEMKDMWKFIRESNILTSDFTLAQFNRIFFKGPKNYIEMFLLPDDLDQKNTYDYVYLMIVKSKDDFMSKYKYHFEKGNKESSNGKDTGSGSGANSTNLSPNNSQANLNYKQNELEVNFDLHNKHQVILLRQFYEAVVRIAYMKYFHLNQPLFLKLKLLIESCIRLNPMFVKKPSTNKRSFNKSGDSSMNTSVLDMKVKSYENSLETFFKDYENTLRTLFKTIYLKSTTNPIKYDMTVTYRFFYETFVIRSKILKEFLEDKINFIGLINIYHKDKFIITEENKNSKELFAYAENLLDCEFIFFEFCEMVFYISRKYFIKNNLQDKKDSYFDIIKHLQDIIRRYKHISENSEKMKYHFPILQYHVSYNSILELKRQREEEDRKKIMELKRIYKERKYMGNEDVNVIPETVENNDEQSSYSEDFDH